MNDHARSEDLAAYIDGLLSTAQKSDLENHFSRCPACLDELVDLAVIMGGRDRVPARFLKQALGDKNTAAPAPLRLRWFFEVAAALLVVVFIGYFFLSNNRFWQTPERQTPSDVMKKKTNPPDLRMADRLEKPALPAAQPGEQAKNDYMAATSRTPEKVSKAAMNKDIPAAAGQALSADKEKGALPGIAPAMLQPALETESLPKQELSQAEAKNKALGSAHLDSASGARPTAQTMDMKAVQIQQSQQPQKKQAAGAGQTAGPEKKLDEALSRNAAAGQLAAYPIRIEGDVSWSNLQNPERIISWSWFPEDLALELQIDGAGTVTAVVVSGKADERLAAQAANEAKKLLFAISEKKSRRARLVAKDAPPN